MELSSAELFLLAWGGVFTISTAYLATQVRRLNEAKLVMLRTLIGVGIGKVKVSLTDHGIRFEDIEEETNKE